MQLRIRTPNLEVPPPLRERLERRVRMSLGRHAGRIAVARVTLSPGTGAHAGSLRCRIHARLRDGPGVVVEVHGRDLAWIVSEAAWRLEHRLARQRPPSPTGRGGATGSRLRAS
jgi:ribosome-associated translation inhibitor RaiA